jgi:hypothetical protein
LCKRSVAHSPVTYLLPGELNTSLAIVTEDCRAHAQPYFALTYTRFHDHSHAFSYGDNVTSMMEGHAIAQAVSHWRRPRFEPGSGHVGFVVEKVALGQVFSQYFGFPCQFSFRQLLHNHLSIIWGWYNRPGVATAPRGPSLTPPGIKKSMMEHSHIPIGMSHSIWLNSSLADECIIVACLIDCCVHWISAH